MYLETKPSNSAMISVTARWYAAMTSRRSSGSSRAAIAVEPTRSQNITVSWRRSAISTRGGENAADEIVAAVSPRDFPQPPQNLALGSLSKLQAEHREGNGDPHLAQKRRRLSPVSPIHLEQRILCLPKRANTLSPGIT